LTKEKIAGKIVWRYLLQAVGFFCTLFFSINKTDGHDITEILLKVALYTITLTPNPNPKKNQRPVASH
jgi:hypothetical protein